MRLAGRMKLGFYPLPLAEADRIRKLLEFPSAEFSAVDPCIGDGAAFARITADSTARRYGIELDAYRAEQARDAGAEVMQGDCLQVQCPAESFSLLYLNPPYDFELGEGQNRRMERLFLEHIYRWLKPAGVLILVVPGERLAECANVLASQFRDIRVYRLTAPESLRYRQVVLFAVRRSRRERERLQDSEITRTRLRISRFAHRSAELPALPDETDFRYQIPESGPVRLVYRGLPLDEIEDLLPRSSAYRQASRILFAGEPSIAGRPLTPLHGGHVGLLCTAGMLNGIFGEGQDRHIAHWQSVKVVEHSEETEDDGTVTLRDKERFTHELNLAFAGGSVETLR